MRNVVRLAIIFAAVVPMLLPLPARADANHGTRDWNYTVYSGPNQFVFNRAAAIRANGISVGDWWGRVALKCTRNGQQTKCNMDVDNMTVQENCEAPQRWGPRDFTTVQNTWYHPFEGAPHPITTHTNCIYRVEAEARVRFLDINVLTPWLDVCSDWVEIQTGARVRASCDVP